MSTDSDKIERIKAAYAREQLEPPKAVKAGDIPVSYEAITPEWLTTVLCKAHPGAAVTGYRLGDPDSGTSNRRRIYLEYNRAGQDAGLPASVFCKATHALVNRILLSTAATYSEVTFYNKIRPLLNIDAPTAYLAVYDPEAWTSMIMLHDIGNEVQFCSHKTVMDRASAENQLALLATVHGQFYDSPAFKGELAGLVTFRFRFRALDAAHGFRKCCEDGFMTAEPQIPPRLFARRAEIWPATLKSVDRQATLPETFTHNDVHLKNWYIRKRPALGLADWQVSCRGHWSRDLCYTIATGLTTADRRAWEQDLVRYYLDRLHAAGGPRISFDEAWVHYREQLLSVLAWWTVTLTPSQSMPDMQPLDITLAFIERITHAMDDLESLDVKH
jgi:aminoglycoside/choline kinase family phosphotransferase